MPHKLCKWGLCKSDGRKDKSITFFPFPKPCKDYRMLKKDPTLIAIQHEPDLCPQCSLCKAWINSCSITNLISIDQINSSCYVCHKHFTESKPTVVQPCPSSARSFCQKVGEHFFENEKFSKRTDPCSIF